MSLIVVTRKIDGKKMYINPNQVCAVYPCYKNNEETIIQFPGTDENYLTVLECVDTVANMMEMYG